MVEKTEENKTEEIKEEEDTRTHFTFLGLLNPVNAGKDSDCSAKPWAEIVKPSEEDHKTKQDAAQKKIDEGNTAFQEVTGQDDKDNERMAARDLIRTGESEWPDCTHKFVRDDWFAFKHFQRRMGFNEEKVKTTTTQVGSLDAQLAEEDLVKQLTEAATKSKKALLVFFSGDANRGGEFCLRDDARFDFAKFIDILTKNFTGDQVDLDLDCNYAGNWIDQAHKWHTEGNRTKFKLHISAFADSAATVDWTVSRKLYDGDFQQAPVKAHGEKYGYKQVLLCDDKYEVLKEVLPTTPEDKNAKKEVVAEETKKEDEVEPVAEVDAEETKKEVVAETVAEVVAEETKKE